MPENNLFARVVLKLVGPRPRGKTASPHQGTAILAPSPQEMSQLWKWPQFLLSREWAKRSRRRVFLWLWGHFFQSWGLTYFSIICTENNERVGSRAAKQAALNRAPCVRRGPQMNTTPSASEKSERIQFIQPIRLHILKIKPVWTILPFVPVLCWMKLRKAYHRLTRKIKHCFL